MRNPLASVRGRRADLMSSTTREHDLQCAGVGGVGEDVVGARTRRAEAVGDDLGGVELSGGDHREQGRRGVRVDEARGDRDVLDPQRFQVQGGRLAVHADVGDVSTGPHELRAQLECLRNADGLDDDVGAQTVGERPYDLDGDLASASTVMSAPNCLAASSRVSARSIATMWAG